MVIALVIGVVWTAVLVLVVALCQISARAERATDGGAFTRARDVAHGPAPARSVARGTATRARGRSVRGVPG